MKLKANAVFNFVRDYSHKIEGTFFEYGFVFENWRRFQFFGEPYFVIPLTCINLKAISFYCWKLIKVKFDGISSKGDCVWKTEKNDPFLSFNFFGFGYVKGGGVGNNNVSMKKCRTTFYVC